MDFNVRTVNINEHQLFHIPEYVEQIEKLDIEVKKAGVFKMVLEESIRGQGTCLSDLTNVNPNTFRENGRVLASKQFLVKLGTHPMIHGFRSSALSFKSKSSTQMKNGDTFLETIKDSKSYENPTCCSLAVSQSGEEGLLHHFFHNVVPRLEVDVCSAYKVKPLNEVLQQGANDAKAVKEFLGALKALPLHEREKLINQSLSTDSRCETDTCSCRGCVLDDIKISTERDCTKWVAYGSGVRVRGEDHIKMTKHFGLYALASTSLLRLLPTSYTGITSSLLYYGTTHSFFGAHVEDSSLYSINYLHYGHCKIWIVVPPSAIGKFHACIASSNVNVHHTSCHNLLSHKYFFVSPQWLNAHDIPFKVVIQKPGECVVVGPNAIHLGWNAGPNIAEACNFANDTWIPYGIVSPKCSCIGGEVHLDMERVIAATKPHLLEVYRRQGIPVVSSEEDPYFYTSILRVHECNHEHHLPQKVMEEKEIEVCIQESEQGKTCISIDGLFPEKPKKQKGRKVIACPKITCGMQYKWGQKKLLYKHFEKFHKEDPAYNQLKINLDLLFPARNKTKKRPCLLCGKMISGRGYQMKRHMNSVKCIV